MTLFTILRRAFASNLGKVSATRGERTRLEAAGIYEPVLQHYLAWRRSLVVVVVIATITSAVLMTYRALNESDERSLCSAVAERLLENAQQSLPAAERALHSAAQQTDDLPAKTRGLLQDAKKTLSAALESDDADDAGKELVAKGKELLKEAKQAVSAARPAEHAGRKPDAAQMPVLKKSAAAADAAEDSDEEEDDEPTTVFGAFADAVHLVSLYAVPLASVAALCWWTRFKRTSRILVGAWAVSFFVPMLIALCPWSWWGYVEPSAAPGKQQGMQYYQAMAEGFLEAIDYLITLLPTVLSLIPGVQRACLRVKTLLPESILPGWFLVAAGPLYALFLLVIFVAVDQIASHPLFFCGMVLLFAAPLVYVVRASVVTRPLISDADYGRLRRVQAIAGGMTLLACVLLAGYLVTREVFGVHLIGLKPETSLLGPMDLVEYVLEFLGRLLFMTVVGADLFMRMNLAAWKDLERFNRSGRAADYGRVMQGMDQIVR